MVLGNVFHRFAWVILIRLPSNSPPPTPLIPLIAASWSWDPVGDVQCSLSVWRRWPYNPPTPVSRVPSQSNQRSFLRHCAEPPASRAPSLRTPLPPEPLIITCEGGLVIFLIILHFISIPPFKTQHENWLPQRSIFIIFPQAHKLSDFGAGWTSRAATSSGATSACAEAAEAEWGGCSLGWLNERRGKKRTLVILRTLKHVR